MENCTNNDDLSVFHPLIFNFNYPFHMNDYELTHLLKFLSEEFEMRLRKMRFIFVFKVLNKADFQSPFPSCYVTTMNYHGAKHIFYSYLYKIIKTVEFPAIHPVVLKRIIENYTNYRMPLEYVSKKISFYCLYHIIDQDKKFKDSWDKCLITLDDDEGNGNDCNFNLRSNNPN